MNIIVPPEEFSRLKLRADLCFPDDKLFGMGDDSWWYELCLQVLGPRCPEPFTGPHKLIVDWSLQED